MNNEPTSNRFTLDDCDWQKWGRNLVAFLAPLGVIYFGDVIGLLQDPEHVFSTVDFIPSRVTLGAIALYVMNAMFDLSRKYVAGSKGDA